MLAVDSGSYEFKFSDGRPPKFFDRDDDPSQRVRPGVLTSEQALESDAGFFLAMCQWVSMIAETMP